MTYSNSTISDANPKKKVIRMSELRSIFPFSESHIYWLIKNRKFPKPFSLVQGGRAKGWFQDEIENWLCKQAKGEQS